MSGFELSDLTASFGGKRVLGPLSLSVASGEQVGLVGKSGAGKSTLIRRLYEEIDGRAALVPQDLGLVNTLPVFHNVFMGQLDEHSTWYNLWTLVRPFRKDREVITDLLSRLGIAEKFWVPAAVISGGQRQRVAIARAMYRNSSLLLADEPASALDGPMAHQVMKLLTERFSTSVIALHDIDLALAYCSRIIGIADGKVVIDEPSERLSVADIQPLY